MKFYLIPQLRLALMFASDNNPLNDFVSCARMSAFSSSVSTFQTRGLLTAAQADDLLQQAQAIKNTMGCNTVKKYKL
ncbi:MAG: hypothetical protein WA941_07120 [Nitrososphaeraceae archaeon]